MSIKFEPSGPVDASCGSGALTSGVVRSLRSKYPFDAFVMSSSTPSRSRGPRNGCTAYGVAAFLGIICLLCMAGLLFRMQKQRQGAEAKAETSDSKATSFSKRRALSPVDMRRVAAALDPEIMQSVPASSDQYIKDLKNPCWEHKGSMSCLPYVVSQSWVTGT